MLKGISPLMSPDMLSALYKMGHGDEFVIGDAHFPAETYASKYVVRADGITIPQLLDAIFPLFELDNYVDEQIITMQPVPGDKLDPAVVASYKEVAHKHGFTNAKFGTMERYAFYERAKKAFLIILSGDTRIYGNVIIRKGVVPVV